MTAPDTVALEKVKALEQENEELLGQREALKDQVQQMKMAAASAMSASASDDIASIFVSNPKSNTLISNSMSNCFEYFKTCHALTH